MNENWKSRLKYDELRDNNPSQKVTHEMQEASSQTVAEDPTYTHVGSTRNLSFEWQDGRKISFNYAYLVSSELNVDGDVNMLTLYFTSHTVTLKGYRLDMLYAELFIQRSRILMVADERYREASDDTYTLTDISASPNK